MKQTSILITILIICLKSYGQDQNTAFNRYRIHTNWDYQDSAYYQIGTKKDTLRTGWTITETKGGVLIQRTLLRDTVVTTKVDSLIAIRSNWKAGEIKHTSDAPDKLFVNPYVFTNTVDAYLNKKFYLKIPENSRIILTHSFVKWSAITIPFAIRPALNDTIGSKVTADLKIGASVSYNYNWETFKNRRIEAKKSALGISAGIGFGFSKVTLGQKLNKFIQRTIQRLGRRISIFYYSRYWIKFKRISSRWFLWLGYWLNKKCFRLEL